VWLAVARADVARAAAALDEHLRRTATPAELRALEAVVDFDQPEADCPACGARFATSCVACPDCGLRFGA
jgi:hypothetical protein